MHVRRLTFVRLVVGSLARSLAREVFPPPFPLCRHAPAARCGVFLPPPTGVGGGHGSQFTPPLARLFLLVSFETVTSKRANAKVLTIYGRRSDASFEFLSRHGG